MNTRAQGTIEYLVIIAIVVVIALVVVGLLLQIMSNFGGMSETSARTAWSSSTPFAIIDYTQDGNLLTVVLQNTSGQTLEFNSMGVEGSVTDLNTLAKSIAAGSKYTINGEVNTTCTSGTKYAFPKAEISIDYNTTNIDNLKQQGAADIVGTCS